MKRPEKLPDEFISGIKEISIDASSIIYMLKTGILGYVSAEIELLACQGIIEEVGWPRLPVNVVEMPEDAMTNDDSVIAVADRRKVPLLSEDLEILQEAREREIPHFNTLMILNYLLLKGRISPDEYPEYLGRLREISRYSDEILEYGSAIRDLVEKAIS